MDQATSSSNRFHHRHTQRDKMSLNKATPEDNELPAPTRPPRRQWFVTAVLAVAIAMSLYSMGSFGDPYEMTPFCEADGTCHEKPDHPSPRTVYSARNKEQYDKWWRAHRRLKQAARGYSNRRQSLNLADGEAQSRPLILIGDSITESWVGTDMGVVKDRAKGVPQVLTELLSSPPRNVFDPLVLGIGGDQTQHVLYRLSHGELRPPVTTDPKTLFVLLIGTNNLGSGELPKPTAKGILALSDFILSQTKGHLLILKVLPRGDGHIRLPRLCPPRCNDQGKPFSSFLPAIHKVNQAITNGLKDLRKRYGANRVGSTTCKGPFVVENGETEVNSTLMPDLLHPNAAGHRLLGDCILTYALGLET